MRRKPPAGREGNPAPEAPATPGDRRRAPKGERATRRPSKGGLLSAVREAIRVRHYSYRYSQERARGTRTASRFFRARCASGYGNT